MSWAPYGGIYWVSGGTQKLHAAKPSASAWNWSLTRNWDYIKSKSTFFPISHGDKYSFSLKSCLPTVQGKKSKIGRLVGKSLFALYLFCNNKHVIPSLNTACCVWAGLHIKEHSFISRFLLPSQLEHASSSPFHLGLVKDTRNDNVGKAVLAGRSVGTWSTQPGQALASQKHIWRGQLTSLCFLAGARSSASLQTDSGRVREQALSLLLCKDMCLEETPHFMFKLPKWAGGAQTSTGCWEAISCCKGKVWSFSSLMN